MISFSYDICITTPDHFFSYLSNLNNNDQNLKQIIEQARSSFSHEIFGKYLKEIHSNLFIIFYLGVLSNYPSSIVTLSLLYNITSNTFIIEQIKSFLLHKKDPSYYLVSQYICRFHFI